MSVPHFGAFVSAFKNRAVLIALNLFPKEAATRFFGKIADAHLAKFMLVFLIRCYSAVFGANLSESEKKPEEFNTFGEFFSRKLKPGARKISGAKNSIASPVDGKIVNFGAAEKGELIQAKGKYYTAESLLCDAQAAAKFNGGSFITIYLHPGDYHRIHAPASGKITGFTYIPGALFPVNGMALNAIGGLFSRNERLITCMQTAFGKIAVVKIGACVVGKIRASYEKSCGGSIVFDSKAKSKTEKRYARPIPVRKGEELGAFELGSTVVLLFEKDAVKFAGLSCGMKIRMGERICESRRRDKEIA